MVKTIIIIYLFFFQIVKSEEFIGVAKIVDGDSININTNKIRLEGIDAPEIKQKCNKSFLKISFIVSLNIKKEYFCGVQSTNKLKKKIGKMQIKCISFSKDRYKRNLATCFLGKTNLNKWMVRNGHAVAYKRYSKTYLADEDFAKKNRLGLWKGSFVRPEKWRKLN